MMRGGFFGARMAAKLHIHPLRNAKVHAHPLVRSLAQSTSWRTAKNAGMCVMGTAAFCGFYTSCDGVYTWGNGAGGRLGHGDEKNCSSPTEVEFFAAQGKTVINLVCGGQFTAALTADGELYTWGNGRFGRLGLGSAANQSSPTLVEDLVDEKVIEVAAGEFHMLALTESGKVLAWGAERGGLGLGENVKDAYEPVQVEFFDGQEVVAVACGRAHSVVLTQDGKVYSFGQGAEGQLGHHLPAGTSSVAVPRVIEGAIKDKTINQIACGSNFTFFCSDDGEVFSCGADDFGQLGLGKPGQRIIADPTLLKSLSRKKVKTVVGPGANGFHAAALLQSGEVLTWGYNKDGQLGNGATLDQPRPTKVDELQGVKELALGGRHTAAVLADGSILVFGAGREGQLGLGKQRRMESVAAYRMRPVKLDVFNGTKVACGTDHTAALGKEVGF